MRNRLLPVLALLTAAASPLWAVDIVFTSPTFEIGTTSTGTPLTAGFTFSLGSFGNFTPTAANENLWLSHFNALGSASWDELFTQFSGEATLANNADPFGVGTQAFVWGYNFTSGSSAEWVLLTNPNWTFPTVTTGTSQPPTQWDISNAGTVAVVGYVAPSFGANPYLQTQSVNTTAVPEPASVALVLGLMGTVSVLLRRKARQLAA